VTTHRNLGIAQRSFAELLKSHRVRRGTTQRQLADLSKVSIRTIRDLERGYANRPRLDTVRLIADGLRLGRPERVEFEIAARPGTGIADLRSVIDGGHFAPPRPIAKVIDRETEIATLTRTLATTSRRWVTLTGLSGIGKTVIAEATAGRLFESAGLPVIWCAVGGAACRQPIPDAACAVVQHIANRALHGPAGGIEDLAALISDRSVLLVLDGYDPRAQPPERITELLERCQGLRVLGTARTAVNAGGGERVFPLRPLPLPDRGKGDDLDHLAEAASVRLLLDHVRQVRPGFVLTAGNADVITELCHCLDGIPAALAALADWFQVDEPEVLVEYALNDPFVLIAEAIPDLRESLRRSVAELEAPAFAMLVVLAQEHADWSVREIAERSGRPHLEWAGFIRRLLALGLVRPSGASDRTRFQVLDLLRTPQVDERLGNRR
jgi:transcriptional regulator with XRE-family HTH domain